MMKNRCFAIVVFIIICILITTVFPAVTFTEEGKADSYWGNIPEGRTFAFVESRYYNGTNYIEVFNVGFFMGVSGEYYANGDWTDLSNVYKREDYYKSETFIEYTENASPGQLPRPEGYPTNDVGGDADGTLPSYNAGTYTSLSWAGFSMFGRKAKLNYNTEAVTNASGVTTYVEIWKVEPELALTLDREQIEHGAEFTASLTINNHFDNMEGLPAAEEVVFIPKNAVQISDTVKENNQYTASFRAVTDPNASELEIEAGVSQDAVNYKPKTLSLIQALPTQDIWSINIEKRWDGVPESERKEVSIAISSGSFYISGLKLNSENDWSETIADVEATALGEHFKVTEQDGERFALSQEITLDEANRKINIILTNRPAVSPTEPSPEPTAPPTAPAGSTDDNGNSPVDTTPKTGDDAMNSAFLAVLAIAAGGVCTAMILYKKRCRKT